VAGSIPVSRLLAPTSMVNVVRMAKRSRTSDDFDSPWKGALQAYFPFFLAFFFPDIHADIDWSRDYVSLDKEFQKIARRAKVGKRLADKLFKVWLKDGSEHWLLIHVEVQGDYEKEFPERMFNYNSAARQLYNKDVVSLAVLCDDGIDWRPTTYGYGRWHCRMELTFRIAKLIDHADQVEALEASANPFAAVVLAHCKAMETKRDPISRSVWKLRIVKGLYQRGWSKDDVRRLFLVIDFIMALPDELEDAFCADLDEFEEENKMPYISSVERIGEKRGLEIGHRKGLIEGIGLYLSTKFGSAGVKLIRDVRRLESVAELRKLKRFLKTADSIDEVREHLK
jgi:hypothetical protein